MARPKKIGLDYFPLDVVFDRKIQALEHIYGNDGFTWVIKFWQEAYQTEFGELNLDGLFGELLAKNCRITTELQGKIIESALGIKLIRKTDDGFYTSDGIKKRMATVSSERRSAINRKKRNTKEKIKESKVKESKTSPHCSPNYFVIPNIEEIKTYCSDRKNTIDANKFHDFYSSKNWMIGKNKMKDWQACIRTWEKTENIKTETQHPYERI